MKEKYKERHVEEDVMANKQNEELEMMKSRAYEISHRELMRLQKWLYNNHSKVLNEYCDKFLGGKRLMFAGGDDGKRI